MLRSEVFVPSQNEEQNLTYRLTDKRTTDGEREEMTKSRYVERWVS